MVPLVSVVIPHYLGDVVSRCLRSLLSAPTSASFEVIVVDDQPHDDGSLGRVRAAFPGTRVTKTQGRHGFGAACNAGIRIARGRYLVILNNDVEVAPGLIDAFVRGAEADPSIGILQAKVLSLRDPRRFDYSGAAGGLIDWLGFPFALGRVFDAIEEDRGQYDAPCEIFWAVGTALLIRRSCLNITGLFDEAFYMHMEEIDLAWRAQLAGFRVVSCPSAVAYHWNGFSLRQGCFRKAFLNHRNNIALLLKNLPWCRLAWTLPLRFLLMFGVVLLVVVRRDWKQPLAAALGMLWVFIHIASILQRRSQARSTRQLSDAFVLKRMHPRSIVVDYFVRRKNVHAIATTSARRRPRIPSRYTAPVPAHVRTLLELPLADR
jgi:GT2 family glycosyltransferase